MQDKMFKLWNNLIQVLLTMYITHKKLIICWLEGLDRKKSVKSMIEINVIYHIINWSTMERIILIGHLSIPNFVIWTANWTFYKLIPLNCFHKIIGTTENSLLFPQVRMSVWLNCNGNGRKYKHIHKVTFIYEHHYEK